jgi:hypothetical protein
MNINERKTKKINYNLIRPTTAPLSTHVRWRGVPATSNTGAAREATARKSFNVYKTKDK